MHFYICPRIVFGDSALEYLRSITGKQALIITDKNIVKMGLVDKVGKELEEANIKYNIFDEVEPDPSVQTCKKAAKMAEGFKPDWIIGVGGGSVLDAAKAAFLCYCSPGLDPDGINLSEVYDSRLKARLIGIPTTSGTGAEVSAGVVLTDTEHQRKIAGINFELVPDVAILDPVMTVGLPPHLTAETGMDALTHAIEGYLSTWRTQFSDAPGLTAIRRIFEFLPRAYKDGSDIVAREEMQNASTQACLCCGNSTATVAHNLAHAMGGLFHMSHGKAVSIFLPYTMEYMSRGSDESKARYADIARVCGIATGSDDKCSKALIAKVRELAKSMKLPMSIKEAGIDRAKYMESMPGLVQRAADEISVNSVTRLPSDPEVEKMFKYAYDGKAIDF